MTTAVYEYFLPVFGFVTITIIVMCCRYCCFASRVKANARNIQEGPQGDTCNLAASEWAAQGHLPTISRSESDSLDTYQPPVELPGYLPRSVYDPPPDFSAVVAPFPVEDDPPPAYEDVIASSQ